MDFSLPELDDLLLSGVDEYRVVAEDSTQTFMGSFEFISDAPHVDVGGMAGEVFGFTSLDTEGLFPSEKERDKLDEEMESEIELIAKFLDGLLRFEIVNDDMASPESAEIGILSKCTSLEADPNLMALQSTKFEGQFSLPGEDMHENGLDKTLADSSLNISHVSIYYNHMQLGLGNVSCNEIGVNWVGFIIPKIETESNHHSIYIPFTQISLVRIKLLETYILQIELNDLQTIQLGFKGVYI